MCIRLKIASEIDLLEGLFARQEFLFGDRHGICFGVLDIIENNVIGLVASLVGLVSVVLSLRHQIKLGLELSQLVLGNVEISEDGVKLGARRLRLLLRRPGARELRQYGLRNGAPRDERQARSGT